MWGVVEASVQYLGGRFSWHRTWWCGAIAPTRLNAAVHPPPASSHCTLTSTTPHSHLQPAPTIFPKDLSRTTPALRLSPQERRIRVRSANLAYTLFTHSLLTHYTLSTHSLHTHSGSISEPCLRLRRRALPQTSSSLVSQPSRTALIARRSHRQSSRSQRSACHSQQPAVPMRSRLDTVPPSDASCACRTRVHALQVAHHQ